MSENMIFLSRFLDFLNGSKNSHKRRSRLSRIISASTWVATKQITLASEYFFGLRMLALSMKTKSYAQKVHLIVNYFRIAVFISDNCPTFRIICCVTYLFFVNTYWSCSVMGSLLSFCFLSTFTFFCSRRTSSPSDFWKKEHLCIQLHAMRIIAIRCLYVPVFLSKKHSLLDISPAFSLSSSTGIVSHAISGVPRLLRLLQSTTF